MGPQARPATHLPRALRSRHRQLHARARRHCSCADGRFGKLAGCGPSMLAWLQWRCLEALPGTWATGGLLPQGEDADYKWAITVMWFWIKGFLGCFGVVLSIAWVLQLILYVFISPPASPFLNAMFTRLDKVFGLFGVLAFAIFCFYLIRAPDCCCARVFGRGREGECMHAHACSGVCLHLMLCCTHTSPVLHVKDKYSDLLCAAQWPPSRAAPRWD